MIPTLGAAASGVVAQTAANGVSQTRVDNVRSQLADRKIASDVIVANVAEADPARATIDLQLATTTLQASAQVFAVLQSSSLLKMLSGG
jgi:flagellin-like hook-associated protein FlgL